LAQQQQQALARGGADYNILNIGNKPAQNPNGFGGQQGEFLCSVLVSNIRFLVKPINDAVRFLYRFKLPHARK
jgi:hypothetical protein